MAIYSVQIKGCPGTHLSSLLFICWCLSTHQILYWSYHCLCHLSGWCKDNFCQITKCFLLHTYLMQRGHCINDTNRRLRDHIIWWSLFFQMPFQSRFVGFLIVPLQSTTKYDSFLIDVLAVHCMQKKHLICFYKNIPLSGFHPTVHLHITECFNFLLQYPVLENQGWLFCICSVFPKWPVDIFCLWLNMYEVISDIFRSRRCSEETD